MTGRSFFFGAMLAIHIVGFVACILTGKQTAAIWVFSSCAWMICNFVD